MTVSWSPGSTTLDRPLPLRPPSPPNSTLAQCLVPFLCVVIPSSVRWRGLRFLVWVVHPRFVGIFVLQIVYPPGRRDLRHPLTHPYRNGPRTILLTHPPADPGSCFNYVESVFRASYVREVRSPRGPVSGWPSRLMGPVSDLLGGNPERTSRRALLSQSFVSEGEGLSSGRPESRPE